MLYIAIVTNRARPIEEVTTILGPFETEHESCKAIVQQITEEYIGYDYSRNRILNFTNLREYMEESIPEIIQENKNHPDDMFIVNKIKQFCITNPDGSLDISDDDVENMLYDCKTAKELDIIMTYYDTLYKNLGGHNPEYGWTFKIQRAPQYIALNA